MDPWGNPRGTSPAWPTDRGYLNKPTDATGLTSVGARYYDPAFGRFISVDPVMNLADPNQWGAYAYANNNPVTRWDPTGLLGTVMGDWQSGPKRNSSPAHRPAAAARPKGAPNASVVETRKDSPAYLAYARLENAGDYDGLIARYDAVNIKGLSGDPLNDEVGLVNEMYSNATMHRDVCAAAGGCAPPCRSAGCLFWNTVGMLVAVFAPELLGLTGDLIGMAFAARVASRDAAALSAARLARDAKAAEVGRAKAAVSGGYSRDGRVVAGCSSNPLGCAEDDVARQLGGDPRTIKFSETTRPRTGDQVPICPRCQGKYDQSQFPPGTKFDPRGPWANG